MYVCMYVRTYVCMYVYVRTYVCMYVRIYIYMCMYVCVRNAAYEWMYVHRCEVRCVGTINSCVIYQCYFHKRTNVVLN